VYSQLHQTIISLQRSMRKYHKVRVVDINEKAEYHKSYIDHDEKYSWYIFPIKLMLPFPYPFNLNPPALVIRPCSVTTRPSFNDEY
jgi:hypothetical protein